MLKIRHPIPRYYANLDTPLRFQICDIWRVGCKSALVEQITTRLLRVLNPGPLCPLATEVVGLNGYGHGDVPDSWVKSVVESGVPG